MADRDFTIPMGPDRTGRINLPEVEAGAGSPADQTIAQPPISTADLRGLDVSASQDEHPVDTWLRSPMDGPGATPADQAAPAAPVEQASSSAATAEPLSSESYVSESLFNDGGEASEENAENVREASTSPVNDVAASLGALRDSIGQGRELKAREKDYADLEEKIRLDREELADRDDILANYMTIAAEQDAIINENTQQRDSLKAQLSQVTAETEQTSEALGRMRDYNDAQLQPYETALGRAQAAADQAKNDERSRKSELNSAESEVRRAEKDGDATTQRARLDVVQAAHDEAVARSNAAKGALEEAQRAYDNLKEQIEQAEAPLENALADLEKRSEQLKEEITRLGDVISAATKRRQYCDSVYQYPAETEKLRQSVEADEDALYRLEEENDELRDRLAQSKAKSTKAKVLIVGIVVFIIVIALVFWYLSSR